MQFPSKTTPYPTLKRNTEEKHEEQQTKHRLFQGLQQLRESNTRIPSALLQYSLHVLDGSTSSLPQCLDENP
jgi:hypothetical protein